MKKTTTYIALGSNMGNRHALMEAALERLASDVGEVRACSTIIETKAYGYTDQDDFLNAVAEVETELEPYPLLEALHRIEADLDRVRLIRWGPRTIDLDIIYYGDLVLDREDLHIPHIDMIHRDFVLGPLAEIAPELVDPRYGVTTARLLEKLKEEE